MFIALCLCLCFLALVLAVTILGFFLDVLTATLDALAEQYLWAAKVAKWRDDRRKERATKVGQRARQADLAKRELAARRAARRATWPAEYRGEKP
jgi:hypothetical protein